MQETRTDTVVIGGGMAGLTAAARAVRLGQSVVVVEVSDVLGGSAQYAGYAWTAPDHQTMDAVNPAGDPALRRALVDRFAAGVEWIDSLGVTVHDAVTVLRFGRGHQFDTMHYIDTCARIVKESNEILLRATPDRLVIQDGRVAGVEVTLPDGTQRRLLAAATILATGGFQADPSLLEAHVHPLAGQMPLRSNPMSTGGGLRLALEAGAATGAQNAGFYGHLIPSGVTFDGPGDFVDLSLYYSEHALMFDLDNERFVDETVGDHLNTMALLERPEARALLIADARVYRDWMVGAYVEGAVSVDKFALASRRGGRCGIAEDLDEIAMLPEEWGYDGGAIRDQIVAFNAVAAGGTHSPARQYDSAPLDEGPYYVIECVPAVTFPFFGVRIDDSARVLGQDGQPVPGLYAAGSDTGGLYDRAYAGGLASALVFGLTAADSAEARRAARA